MNTMEITPNKPITENSLKFIAESFEEQKDIKVLSIYELDDNVYGVYINNPQDTLSFTKAPLSNMRTDIDGHNIFMMELGFLLHLIYKNGSLQMFNILTAPSSIDCSSDLFDDLLSMCSSNPPLNLASFHLIKWIDKLNDDDLNMSTIDLIDMVENFMKIEPLDVDVSNKNCEILMKNNLNLVKQELKSRNFKKISEATISKIDKLFVKLQMDLYMTDDK